jgi:RNA polymerase sigma factor (sigma-70 family)
MTSVGSVTKWIQQLKGGEEAALTRLYDRYWPFLLWLARRKLSLADRRVSDEEDLAQEAFFGLYRALQQGNLPQLSSRHDFLVVLALITARRASDQLAQQQSAKRGGGNVLGESAIEALCRSSDGSRGIDKMPGNVPTPEEQVILRDCYQYYVGGLPEELHGFAELYLAGFTQKEIAERMNCVIRTVRRKTERILGYWRKMASAELK